MARDNDNDDGGDFDLDALIDQKINERASAEAKKRDRNKQPKDFGDFLDRVADAVLDKIDERAEQRRAERDAEDEPPSRGKGDSAFSRFWNGPADEKSA
jgi:hypothetical protein